MDFERYAVSNSPLDQGTAESSALVLDRPASVFLLQENTTFVIVLVAIGLLGLLGLGKLVVDDGRSDGEGGDPSETTSKNTDTATSGDSTSHGQRVDDPQLDFEERIGEETIERIEEIAPSAVSRVRSRLPLDGSGTRQDVDAIERDLRNGIEDAIAQGKFDPSVESRYDGEYEIVNLTSEYREVTLPNSQETLHITEIEAAASDTVDDDFRNATRTLSMLYEHCREIETYIGRHEDSFADQYDDIEQTLEDVRSLTERLEDSLNERVGEFVIEGRHGSVTGAVEIERELEAARDALHDCSFEDATRQLDSTERDADELLVTVDFLGGLVGTVEHGEGRVDIPSAVPVAFVSEVIPLIEEAYDASTTVENQTVVVEESSEKTESDGTTGRASTEPADRDAEKSESRSRVAPEDVADEILFVLRELDGDDGNRVECQTEGLPESIVSPEVLAELATFCRRQTDLVDDVKLQEDAPPGFFEVEFSDRMNARDGLETLRERFAEQHGHGS